jgi:rhamnosyl/mannosyltransferase
MKVLHVYKTSMEYSHGGVESFIDSLCQETSALGTKNTVLCLAKSPHPNPLEKKGYTLYSAKELIHLASTGFSLEAFTLFNKLLKTHDIIHYHFPNPFADLLQLLNLFSKNKKPSIVTYHSDIIKQRYWLSLYQPLLRYFLNSVNHIVATSPNYLASSAMLQAYKHKTSVIPIGINISHCRAPSEEKIRYWQNRLSQPFFLFVGALRYYKGLQTALEAIQGTDLQLVIAGKGGVGHIENELRSITKRLKLNNVIFLGSIDEEDKAALLTLCSAFVFPSHLRSEAFGIALLEAAAYGKAMISCEIGTGTSYINLNGETGFVIEPNSPQALRRAMQAIISNAAQTEQFGKHSVKRVLDFFDAAKSARQYHLLYHQATIKN